MWARTAALYFFATSLLGCAGPSATAPRSPAPTSPSPVASPNRGPEIVSVSIRPSLGIVGLTTFAGHVDARDPDGDPVAIVWSDAGARVLGDKVDVTFTATRDVTSPLTVTITDGKGGTTTAKASFVAGDIACSCVGYFDFGPQPLLGFGMQLNATDGKVTGTITDYTSYPYRSGVTDPASPGHIDHTGRFSIRFKFPHFGGDFVFDGQIAPYDNPREGSFENDYIFTGRVNGGKFDGHTVTFGERPRY